MGAKTEKIPQAKEMQLKYSRKWTFLAAQIDFVMDKAMSPRHFPWTGIPFIASLFPQPCVAK